MEADHDEKTEKKLAEQELVQFCLNTLSTSLDTLRRQKPPQFEKENIFERRTKEKEIGRTDEAALEFYHMAVFPASLTQLDSGIKVTIPTMNETR